MAAGRRAPALALASDVEGGDIDASAEEVEEEEATEDARGSATSRSFSISVCCSATRVACVARSVCRRSASGGPDLASAAAAAAAEEEEAEAGTLVSAD